jgi:prepilin-type N-terminal cleavage/methylation domain-containing protein
MTDWPRANSSCHFARANGWRAPLRRPSAVRGYTLVELLVVVAIIAILVGAFVGALQAARESASRTATEALIARLHGQIMLRWESYRTRRLPIEPRVVAVNLGLNPANSKDLALARLLILRELMRIEMPDRLSDVDFYDPSATRAILKILPGPTALAESFARRIDQNPQCRVANAYEGAEFLYMIVTSGHEDDVLGTEQFSLRDVGDEDEDGLPEFHDAWGRPISWIRWPAGFVSELQPEVAGDPAPPPSAIAIGGVLRDPVRNHDPFDPLKVDPLAFSLTPLIVSAGGDGDMDVDHAEVIYANAKRANVAYPNDPYWQSPNSPFNCAGSFFDTDNDGDSTDDVNDNLTNHAITARQR